MKQTKITSEKVLNSDGEKMIKVVNIENVVSYNKLPKEYVGGYPYYYKDGDDIFIQRPWKGMLLVKGMTYSVRDYNLRLELLFEAGERLTKINKNLIEWKGTWETLI